MASIEEVRGGIAQANDKAQESLGALQQAISSIDEVQQNVQAAIQAAEGVAARL